MVLRRDLPGAGDVTIGADWTAEAGRILGAKRGGRQHRTATRGDDTAADLNIQATVTNETR